MQEMHIETNKKLIQKLKTGSCSFILNFFNRYAQNTIVINPKNIISQSESVQKLEDSNEKLLLKTLNSEVNLRIYNMRQFLIIDGTFKNNCSINAVVHFNNLTIKNVEVRILQNCKFDISGNDAEISYKNSKVIYKGGIKNCKRHGLGKTWQMQSSQHLYTEVTGFYNNDIQEGYFLTIAKNQKRKEQKKCQNIFFSYGIRKNKKKKGKHYYCNFRQQYIIDFDHLSQQQLNNIDHDRVKQQLDQVQGEQQFKQKLAFYEKLLRIQKTLWNEYSLKQMHQASNLNQMANLDFYCVNRDHLNRKIKIGQMLSNDICDAFLKQVFRTQVSFPKDISYVEKHPQTYIFPLEFMEILTSQDYQFSQVRPFLQILNKQYGILSGAWRNILFPFASFNKTHFVLFHLQIDFSSQRQQNLMQLFLADSSKLKKNINSRTIDAIRRFLKEYVVQQGKYFLDKLESQNSIAEITQYKQFCRLIIKVIDQLEINISSVPTQDDAVSCGVYMCYFAQRIAKNQINMLSDQFNPLQYRKHIHQQLTKQF